jgi:hypothetical protein
MHTRAELQENDPYRFHETKNKKFQDKSTPTAISLSQCQTKHCNHVNILFGVVKILFLFVHVLLGAENSTYNTYTNFQNHVSAGLVEIQKRKTKRATKSLLQGTPNRRALRITIIEPQHKSTKGRPLSSNMPTINSQCADNPQRSSKHCSNDLFVLLWLVFLAHQHRYTHHRT